MRGSAGVKSEGRRLKVDLMDRARRQNPPAVLSGLIQTSPFAIPTSVEAVCIGCGCSDSHACVTGITLDDIGTGLEGCFWVKVDYKLGIGVCSECVDRVGEFEDKVNCYRRGAEARRNQISGLKPKARL